MYCRKRDSKLLTGSGVARVVKWAENQSVLVAKLRFHFQNQIAIAKSCNSQFRSFSQSILQPRVAIIQLRILSHLEISQLEIGGNVPDRPSRLGNQV